MSGIYIHIPFCKQACSYCDFYFVTRDRLIPAFVENLVTEITHGPVLPEGVLTHTHPDDLCRHPLKTIYLGGGTPSRLHSDQLQRITEALADRFDLSQIREFTVEVNPEDLTREWLDAARRTGVTRLSMGIQSFQPELLEFMHRAHSEKQAHQALDLVAETGFDSFSVDLIYGNPGQSRRQLHDDLMQLLRYHPPHISAYSLSIEPKTRLGKQMELGRLTPQDDDEVAAQARLIRDTLAENGIYQYEVSNYAQPGHEAVHNSAYWRHENYLGLGPAAHSFYWPDGADRAIRWYHPPDIHAWQHGVSSLPSSLPSSDATPAVAPAGNAAVENSQVENTHFETETLSLEQLAEERIMLGLRTTDGISTEELGSRYNYVFRETQQKEIMRFREKGWLAGDEPLRLTDEGFAIADAITVQLIR